MKAIVFGGSGFLGSHVADVLTQRGIDVIVFDKRPSTYLQANQQMIVGDILDVDAVQRAIEGGDVIYHFAAFADLDEAAMRPMDAARDNILGTLNLLDAAAKEKVKRFVFASTIYVYSTLGGFYRCSKQSAELYVEEFERVFGLDFTILRYGTLYGPRADKHNSVWRYLQQALTEKRIHFPGTGEETREYIHVRDAAKLTADVLSKEFRNQHVIITGHHPMKAADMLQMIKEILNNKITIDYEKPGEHHGHYNITPYSFIPKIGNKLVSNQYVDMGQGLLESLNEIHQQTNQPTHAQ